MDIIPYDSKTSITCRSGCDVTHCPCGDKQLIISCLVGRDGLERGVVSYSCLFDSFSSWSCRVLESNAKSDNE